MATKKCSVFSFFAGAGFLDLGFELADGYEIVLVNEFIDEFARSYKYARDAMGLASPRYGLDIASIEKYSNGEGANRIANLMQEERSRGRLVGFIAGPPCPDFSIGGKNRGGSGDSGRLSALYADLIAKLKPDFFLFENVKGLWRTKKHRGFFDSLKSQLQRAGYATTEKLVNAMEYGIAQDRDRIILIGLNKNLVNSESLRNDELPHGVFKWERSTKYPLHKIRSVRWPTTTRFEPGGKMSRPTGIPADLTVQYWFDKNNVENHANAKDHFTPRAGLNKFRSIDEGDDSKKSYKRLHRWRYSPTCAYGNNEVHLHPYKARRLSVAEALSLQSLPKEFELPPDASLSTKFKMVGNGVPFILAKGVAEDLLYFLDENTENHADRTISLSSGNRPTAKRQVLPLH